MIGEVSQLANDFWILLAMVIFFAAMLSIGFIYSKRSNSSSKEYFAGGRGVGPWLTALSAEASDMSGWLLMGLPGLAYFTGAADPMWTAIGLALGTYLNWKLVARRLRRYSVVAGDAITIPDFFAKRFHDKKGVVSTIAAVIILVFFSVYVGSCFVTVGKLFATLFGFDYHVMMIIGAVVVFVYTVVGGYLSVVMTDFIQGMLMFFALAVVFIGTVASAGGIDNTVEFLRAIPGYLSGTQVAAPKLDPATGQQLVEAGKAVFGAPSDYGIITIISMLAWGLGYFGMPQVLVRFLSIRSVEEVRKSRIIATSWCVISLGCAVCIGLVGRAMMPTELLTSTDAENHLHRAGADPAAELHVRRGGLRHFRGLDELQLLVSDHRRFGHGREHLPRAAAPQGHRQAGHDRGQGHAGGHVPVRHSGGIRPELVDLPGGVLRVGRAWCLIRPVDAVLAILASRQQGRRRGRHAVRHGGRADLAQPRQALGRRIRHL